MASKDQTLPTAVSFAIAGASGISAWLFVHPADVVKVRMQLMGKSAGAPVSAVAAAKEIVKSDGIAGLYSGLTAGIVRQAVYTTLRLGLFDQFKEVAQGKGASRREVTAMDRAAIGLAAGGTASFFTCPVEVCLVRMQADGRLPPAERRGYKNIGDALVRVAREEGVRTYWRGATPTVARAMVVSMTQLGTYDQAKTALTPILGDTTANHLSSALLAAVVYSFASLPLDSAKTRMQTASKGGGGVQYTGTIQTLLHVARSEGVASLWKGFIPYFVRSGGHTVGMFMFKEQYTRLTTAYYFK